MNADERSLALATGALFISAFIPVLAGGIMFTGRKQLHWTRAQSRRYLYWERSLWILGIVLLACGFSLFAGLVQARHENILSRIGQTGFLLGVVLIVVAEAQSLDTQTWGDYLVRLSVILILVSQAIFGIAILQVQVLPQWLGWATIIWNLVSFGLLFRAKDPYFPGIYYIMPLIIGVILINLAK